MTNIPVVGEELVLRFERSLMDDRYAVARHTPLRIVAMPDPALYPNCLAVEAKMDLVMTWLVRFTQVRFDRETRSFAVGVEFLEPRMSRKERRDAQRLRAS